MKQSTDNPRSSLAKKLLMIFSVLAIVILLLMAFLPTIVSTEWGKEKVVALVNSQISGKIEIKSLSLGWFGPQIIEQCILKDPDNATIVSVDKIKADSSLFNLWLAPASGLYEIQNLNAHLTTGSDGTTNLERAITKGCCPTPIVNQSLAAIVLKNVQARLNSSQIHITGETQQSSLIGRFTIDTELSGVTPEQLIKSGRDWNAIRQKNPDTVLKANIDIVNFPVPLIEQFIVLKSPELAGLVTDLLGPQLNMNFQNLASDGIALTMQIASQNLNASGEALFSQNITLGKPFNIALTISPQTYEKLLIASGKKTDWALTSSAKIHLDINHLQLPLSSLQESIAYLDLTTVGLNAILNLEQATFSDSTNRNTLAMQSLQITYETVAGTNTSKAFINGQSTHNGQPMQMQFAMTIPKPPKLSDFGKNLGFLSINGNLTKMPMAFLDDRFNANGLMMGILGNHVDLAIDLQPIENKLQAILQVASDQLNISMNVGVTPHTPSYLTVEGTVSHPNNNGFLNDILGSQTSFSVKTNFNLTEGLPQFGIFNLNVDSDLAHIELSGEITDGRRLRLIAPAMIDYTLTSAGLETMGIASDNYLFSHKSPMRMTILSPHIPLNLQDISKLFISGDIKINDLALSHKTAKNESIASLDDITAKWTIDGANKLITLDFAGATRLEHQAAGKLNGAIAIENWLNSGTPNFNQAKIHVNTSIQKLPTAMLGAISGQPELIPIIGNSIDMGIKGHFLLSPSPIGNLSLNIYSTHVNGTADLVLDDAIHLKDQDHPADFNFKLTPQSYAAMRRWLDPNYAGDVKLTEDSTAVLKVKSLFIPLKTHHANNAAFIHAGIDADLLIDHIAGLDKSKKSFSLNKIKGNISTADLAKQIAFNMNAQGYTGQGAATNWKLDGTLENGFTNEGSINNRDLSLTLNGNVENLPIPLLCHLVCKPDLGRQIEAVIGPTLNAKVKAQLQRMNGPVYLDIKGSNGNILLDAHIYEGILTLRNDLKAQVTITPQLGQYVLQEFIPIINGIQSSDQPMRLTISKQGFALPLKNIDPTNVNIEKAALELGNVKFSNHSQLAKVLGLLTPNNTDEIHVWLTPAYISLKNGIIKLERLDLLVNDRYPVATWGTVDMGHDRVNMMIGLSGSAIAKAFGVNGIPKGYMLQVPLRGTMSNASIDKTKAAGKLSALVAQSQGGPQGLVIGTVLDIASGGMHEPKIPAPTTNPLPWSKIMDEVDTVENVSDKGKPANPIEEISKGAGSLIKKLFK